MNESEILEKMLKGEIKIHEVENYTMNDSNQATKLRRLYLETKYGIKLNHTGNYSIDFTDSISRNIENSVGITQVPLGYAGDLKVNGDYAKGSYPILLATTEGRLVAGISRGITVFNMANGVDTTVIKEGMTRDVLVRVSNAKDASKLMKWVKSDEGFEFLSEAFSKSTKHGKLKEVKPYATGRDVHLRFRATTGAAMGMNMVTIAAKYAVDEMIKHLEKQDLKIIVISESGNVCSDKKPAFINVLEGRGVSVIADAIIPRDVVLNRFRVEPKLIAELNKVKNLQGSAIAGSHGFNAHVANILAAMYVAHGQDVAQIVEGSQALTDAAVLENGDLYVSCYLPAIEVGTFGGGTKRETQQEALKILGLYGDNDKEGITRLSFAEIVAAACLVGDINLLAVQAAGELSKTHGQIKRG